MRYERAFVPYGGYWTTPFCRWQGSFSTLHPIRFAADIAVRALAERGIPVEAVDSLCIGMTVPCKSALFGGPWLAGMMGIPFATGPTISQACATSVRCIAYGAEQLQTGNTEVFLAVTADKTSNSPHIYYPNPAGVGGIGEKEDIVLDSFGNDPYARNSMIQTAENVAKETGISREEQDRVALVRHQQYQNALKDDAAFQKRYMFTPVEVMDARGKKVVATVTTDEGVFPTTAEGLAKLKPMLPDGTITFGTQTYPADGNAAMLLTDRDRAKELSREKSIEIRILSHAQGRAKKGFMPMSNVPAVRTALARAEIDLKDVTAITTHVPFAVNDIYLARELGIQPEEMNRFGCSLVWGHPQGPTGMRGIIELIEELARAGGGYGLFTGCAAGDTAGALVLKVTVS